MRSTDLYLPRKCGYTNKLTTPKDKESIRLESLILGIKSRGWITPTTKKTKVEGN